LKRSATCVEWELYCFRQGDRGHLILCVARPFGLFAIRRGGLWLCWCLALFLLLLPFYGFGLIPWDLPNCANTKTHSDTRFHAPLFRLVARSSKL
jgi:hypothetical protein